MKDYNKIEASHLLSEYKIRIPYWRGENQFRKPLAAWARGGKLPWYQAYNAAKHDRHAAFAQATFDQLMDAVCGLVALLSAQFHTQDFAPGPELLALRGAPDGFENCIGSYFGMQPPKWPIEDRYTFSSEDWQALIKTEADPFVQYPYPVH